MAVEQMTTAARSADRRHEEAAALSGAAFDGVPPEDIQQLFEQTEIELFGAPNRLITPAKHYAWKGTHELAGSVDLMRENQWLAPPMRHDPDMRAASLPPSARAPGTAQISHATRRSHIVGRVAHAPN